MPGYGQPLVYVMMRDMFDPNDPKRRLPALYGFSWEDAGFPRHHPDLDDLLGSAGLYRYARTTWMNISV